RRIARSCTRSSPRRHTHIRCRRTVRCARTVLAVVLFIAFWVVVAFGLFFVAIRGGLAGAREALHTQSTSGRKVVGVVFALLYIGFGIAMPLAFLTGNHANASKKIGSLSLTPADKHGRELFGEHCG